MILSLEKFLWAQNEIHKLFLQKRLFHLIFTNYEPLSNILSALADIFNHPCIPPMLYKTSNKPEKIFKKYQA